MRIKSAFLAFASAFLLAASCYSAEPIKALIIDGQNNHAWKDTTPVLKKILEESGRFQVDVATTPAKGQDMSGFRPEFSRYGVVISNYTGDHWPEETRTAFEKYVREGGGFVVYHAANNAFTDWPEYNRMIGVGGWGGRTEKSGPYARWRDGKLVVEQKPGKSGSHGKRLPFQVVMRDREHPISAGLPEVWMHVEDELYDSLRGPAEAMTLLGTAFSDPSNSGTGEHEPMLFTIAYGKGRVFHTALGHDPVSMEGVGFIVTLLRGAEWAATGKVTQAVPADFPTADQATRRSLK